MECRIIKPNQFRSDAIAKDIEQMDALRDKQLAQGKLSDEEMDGYLSMSYALFEHIQSYDDAYVASRAATVRKALIGNKNILQYDILQDGFWREAEPAMSVALDDLTIALRGDDFLDMSEKHHVLGAIKHAICEGAGLEERIAVYDTILPRNSDSKENMHHSCMESLRKYGIVALRGTDIIRARNRKDLEMILTLAKSADLDGLRISISGKTYSDAEELHPLICVENSDFQHDSLDGAAKQIGDYFRKIAFGNASCYVQYRMESVFEAFKAKEATTASLLWNAGWSVAALAYGSCYWLGGVNLPGAQYCWIATIPLVNELLRAIYLYLNDEDGCGSVLGKLVFYPMAAYLKKHNRKRSNYLLDQELLVEARLGQNRDVPNRKVCAYASHDDLERLAGHQVSAAAESSLNYMKEFHHRQANAFAAEIAAGPVPVDALDKRLSRAAGAYTISCSTSAKPYTKVSSLTCFEGRRYVLTFVNPADTMMDIDFMCTMLKDGGSDEASFKELFAAARAKYMHISCFEGCRKAYELAGIR